MAAGTGWMTRFVSAAQTSATPQDISIPLKIGHRAANMKMLGNFDVFKMARRISGLMGVELQVASGNPNLRDLDVVRRYKREASRWGMMVPSVAGVWDPGVSILQSVAAADNATQSIRVAEILGASVVLVAFFQKDAPDMSNEASYGPVVQLLKRVAPSAADAGVTLGLENSLSPSDNRKLLELVSHPNIKVYYDIHNMAHYGYAAEAIPGIKLLGPDRICQVHLKNRDRLIEGPGLIDWSAALLALNEIGYAGWYVFETDHKNSGQLIEATGKNIAFLRKNARMPVG